MIFFRRIFKNKHKTGEILFQNGDTSINSLPLVKHDDRGKRQVMVSSQREVELEELSIRFHKQSVALIARLDRF